MRVHLPLTMACLLLLSCYGQAQPPTDWSLVRQARVQVQEPSGLCLDPATGEFWTVSDETGMVYRINAEGRVTRTLAWSGDDLEGICLDPRDGSLWIACERDGMVVNLTMQGGELARHVLESVGGGGNSGLEGIECDEQGRLWLVKEKDPGLLLIFDPASGGLETRPLDFARDYSGLALDPERGGIWALSDESESLTFLGEDGSRLVYDLGLERLEGVAVAGNQVWLVSDSNAILYEIQLH